MKKSVKQKIKKRWPKRFQSTDKSIIHVVSEICSFVGRVHFHHLVTIILLSFLKWSMITASEGTDMGMTFKNILVCCLPTNPSV